MRYLVGADIFNDVDIELNHPGIRRITGTSSIYSFRRPLRNVPSEGYLYRTHVLAILAFELVVVSFFSLTSEWERRSLCCYSKAKFACPTSCEIC